jgi:hypothetical protein
MLEHSLRTMYRDELAKLNLNASDIYDVRVRREDEQWPLIRLKEL